MKQILNNLQKLKTLTFLLLLTLTALNFTACEKDDDDDDPKETPETGNQAPVFSLTDTDGKKVQLSDYEGKVIVLFFFGNGCPSCKAAGPTIEAELVKPYMDNDNYQLLALDQWDGNLSSVQDFKESTGLSVPVLQNASSTATSYKSTFDRLVVINKEGKILFSGTQGASKDIAAVRAVVDKELANDKMPDDKTPDDNATEAAAFSLMDTDGNTVKLADYDGKVVVLFFFGNSCPSCKAVAPTIESDLVKAYASNANFQLLALDQWDGNKSSVASFKSSTGLSVPVLLNASSTASAYKSTYDRLIVIDKKGYIRFSGTQLASKDLAAAKKIVDQYL